MATSKKERIIIARTDSIGDVMLTLPLCTWIKQHRPGCEIIFIGRSYTQPIVKSCQGIDVFIDRDELFALPLESQIRYLQALHASTIIHVFPDQPLVKLAHRAGIPIRIATGRRWFTLLHCNRPVFFSRKKSTLHEAQLNFRLCGALGLHAIPGLPDIAELYRFAPQVVLRNELSQLVSPEKINVILHPLSRGSAVNWGLDNFLQLIHLLDPHRFNLFITGTENEGKIIRPIVFASSDPHVYDMTGKMTLSELIAFIHACDALVAASTGPLHIAAALGKKAIGLYSPLRPMHPGRWAPIGKQAEYLVSPVHPPVHQTLQIAPIEVFQRLMAFAEEKLKNKSEK